MIEIDEALRLGIDLGIGSCGWALIRYLDGEDERQGEIVAMGARTWDVPETDKERTPTNQLRGTARRMRRVLKRRRQRMAESRTLFVETGLLESARPDALKIAELDPWDLRAEGLQRQLTGPEFAVALGHIAKHRGFKSNSKRGRGANAADESSKMLAAIDATRERLGRYTTVGQMFARDEAFAGRKRNRDGNFDRSILRDDQAAEVGELFKAQRKLGNPLATADLEERFAEIAFFQSPLRDSDDRVGECQFESGEKRAARHAPSFERFRFLSRLTALRVGPGGRMLEPVEIAQAESEFGKNKKFSYANLRKLLKLDPSVRFAGVPQPDESRDLVARSGNAAEGTASLRVRIEDGGGEIAWHSLSANAPEKLDAAAAVITFRDDLDSIRRGLTEIGFEKPVLAALMAGVEDGKTFASFKGAGNLSVTACKKINCGLRNGLDYDKSRERAGYLHSARPSLAGSGFLDRNLWRSMRTIVDEITNPIARKAVTEAHKQIKALLEQYGLPGKIHVELARDLGKSKEERDKISSGIDKRNNEKDRLRVEFNKAVGCDPSGPEDLLRFELWKEQNNRCLYTDKYIDPSFIVSGRNDVQIDHILPWSKSADDSFKNKTLCFTKANSDKKGRIPFDWAATEPEQLNWEQFVSRVESNKNIKRYKKRNFLLIDDTILIKKFRERNLNDTRYACRLLLYTLNALYPKEPPKAGESGEQRRRVYARPGPLTDRLRRTWGIQDLKKELNENRVRDDRHHALDALIVAATTESALVRLTKAFQEAESKGWHRDLLPRTRSSVGFDLPWPKFVAEARKWMGDDENGRPMIFVSRAERRRARGEAHGATIRAIGEYEGREAIYERKPVAKLKIEDLALVKDPERNGEVIAELRRWIAAGKPASAPPLKRFGGLKEEARTEPIRKISVRSSKKADVLVRDGAADRGEMTRVDVFRKQNKRGWFEYFLVPIYPHQVFDKEGWSEPPNRAIQANMDEDKWPEINDSFEFCWSIYPLSLIEIVKPDGELILGYSRGVSRSTGAFTVSPPHTLQEMRPGIGARTLASLKKFTVDRLGRRFEIERETRSWRGAACT